jgi:glycosyltransferase involved in cell wall biosynthesis
MMPKNLPAVWKDFAGDERGVILTIWNPGWLPWLSDPSLSPQGPTRTFLESRPFERWGYFPVDAEGPNGRLPWDFATIEKGFDRILSYSKWQADMTERTLSQPPFNRPGENRYLPHGTERSIFCPKNRDLARQQFILNVTQHIDKPLPQTTFLVGVIATNSARKDWAMAFEVCQELLRRDVDVLLWAHTDALKQRNWNFEALTAEYGLTGRVLPTVAELSDDDIAWALSACDVTLGIGLGEGWGLPASESLAVGTPCVTGNYSGVTEFMPPELLINPIGFYNDGYFNHKRPVYKVSDWADKVQNSVRLRTGLSLLDPRFYWDNCWPEWEKWLREGL